MDNNRYLTEEKYQKGKKIFIILYLILIIIGIMMIVSGIILVVKNSSFDYINIGKIIGIVLIIAGIALTILSSVDIFKHLFTRNIQAYYAQQKMPIVKDAVKEASSSAKEGINK